MGIGCVTVLLTASLYGINYFCIRDILLIIPLSTFVRISATKSFTSALLESAILYENTLHSIQFVLVLAITPGFNI